MAAILFQPQCVDYLVHIHMHIHYTDTLQTHSRHETQTNELHVIACSIDMVKSQLETQINISTCKTLWQIHGPHYIDGLVQDCSTPVR